jgi:uncharacterized membrane protein YfcA
MIDFYWCLSAFVIFIGCTVQTAMGFGMAVFAAPIIVLYKPEWVPIILTIVVLILSLKNAWNLRANVDWKHITPPMISRIPGTLIGVWVLTQIPHHTLQLLVAGMVMAAILVTAFAKPFSATIANMAIAGLISGFTGSTTGIGGPPMALVMQHGNSQNTRANLSVYFAYSCLLSLLAYQLMGLMSKELWLTGITFIPVGLAGFFVGIRLRDWVDARFRPLLLILCSISAAIAFYGALTH